ncbi:MAG: DevR family CRISPR-associated autoregulator [Acidobacteria bacterium]|nr:DevR family CRISPR-associated autoregulator [Acidobacteriota bacterium]
MNSPVFEIAILGRAIWNLHSLNNEGTVGNVSEPRTVILADGSKSDGISGEMLKHIHAQNVWLVADDKSVFCQPCQTLQPQKADVNETVNEASGKAKKDQRARVVLDAALKDCALCDLHGFLRTNEAVPRASTVEFGWAVAIRNGYHRDMHLHARHAVEGRTDAQRGAGEAAAQMIYHRPTRSGTYAFVSVFQPWRIGLNEVNYEYVEGVDREARNKLAIEAYKATFARTDGAMTSTRLPHVEALEGVVLVSGRNFPVPVTSPLQDDYREKLEQLQKAMEGLELRRFDSLPELYTILSELVKRPLFTLQMGSSSKRGKR